MANPYKACYQTDYVFTIKNTSIYWRPTKQVLVATSSNPNTLSFTRSLVNVFGYGLLLNIFKVLVSYLPSMRPRQLSMKIMLLASTRWKMDTLEETTPGILCLSSCSHTNSKSIRSQADLIPWQPSKTLHQVTTEVYILEEYSRYWIAQVIWIVVHVVLRGELC